MVTFEQSERLAAKPATQWPNACE